MIPKKEKRVPVETYSRVVGYYRPVDQWNKGKQEEYADRYEHHISKLIDTDRVCKVAQ